MSGDCADRMARRHGGLAVLAGLTFLIFLLR